MIPETSLPLPSSFDDDDAYVKSLLNFVTSSELHQSLCSGVHILDFFTREPDLYESLLNPEWRGWFDLHEIGDILDLILREDLISLLSNQSSQKSAASLQDQPPPPRSLLRYIQEVRSLCLERKFMRPDRKFENERIPPHIAIGMKEKKVHEVSHFASYVDRLTAWLDVPLNATPITSLVDFGSGQNYLGRFLASRPYSKNVIAVESRPHNVEGARSKDVVAGIAAKTGAKRDKKVYRANSMAHRIHCTPIGMVKDQSERKGTDLSARPEAMHTSTIFCAETVQGSSRSGIGSVQHVQKHLNDGDLSSVIDQVSAKAVTKPNLMVMSLHSCGNLSHHGLRSLILNNSVSAVAVVGCCYNLLTEYNPSSIHGASQDQHGFPMSARLRNYIPTHPQSRGRTPGIRLSITPRMLAVQAPQNWTPAESSSFFTRHFYRALLQRIFLDRGAVDAPASKSFVAAASDHSAAGTGVGVRSYNNSRSAAGGTPIIIGSLRKQYYADFVSYVRGALSKLATTTTSFAAGHGEAVARVLDAMRDISDEEIANYEARYAARKKHLSIVWGLMAFSAQLIEAVVLVDRWQWLREQELVSDAWVEAVWDYEVSPRNLAVIGLKNKSAWRN